jgi:hypothetical protein
VCVSFLAKVSLVGRPFRVENGVVVAMSTPFSSRALGIAPVGPSLLPLIIEHED